MEYIFLPHTFTFMEDKSNQQSIEPLKYGMVILLKSIRRGAVVCRHSNGEYFLATTSNSKLVKKRNVSGLLKRVMLEVDTNIEEDGMVWYRLTELGKSINI